MRLWICLILIHLTACGGGGDNTGDHFVPTVKIECSSAQVGDCALNGKSIFAGIIEDLAMDCDNTLHGSIASQRQLLFTASGSTSSTTSGIYLVGTVNSWTNSTGGSQSTLNEGSYRVCAFVDSNNNGTLDANEPVGTGQVTTSDTYYILNTWAAGR